MKKIKMKTRRKNYLNVLILNALKSTELKNL